MPRIYQHLQDAAASQASMAWSGLTLVRPEITRCLDVYNAKAGY